MASKPDKAPELSQTRGKDGDRPKGDTTAEDQAIELALQADVEKAVHNLVYFGDGTPRPLP